MASRRLLIVPLLALAVGGCASGGSKQLTRIQSQVGMLDERVTQLERVGTSPTAFDANGSSSDANWSSAADSGAVGGSSAKHKSSTARSSKKSKRLASGKPSTKEVQQALKAAGFYQGELDGKMGPITRQAVEEFQRINGLKADGVVGRQTWSKLEQYAELSGDAGTYTK